MASYNIIKAIEEDTSDLWAARMALSALHGLIKSSNDEIARAHAQAYVDAFKARLEA